MSAGYEYRVIATYSHHGEEVRVNRPEGPFRTRAAAEIFAARFTSPKFTGAWVERRRVGRWTRLRTKLTSEGLTTPSKSERL